MKAKLLAAALFAVACNSPSNPTETPAAENFQLIGQVKSLSGKSVDGSVIRLDGTGGRTTGLTYTANIVNDTFTIENMEPGTYNSAITGNVIVPRTDEEIHVYSSPLSFNVLKWGETIKGVHYDNDFDDFFDRIARGNGYVRKWDLDIKPPKEIYIVSDGVSERTLERVKSHFEYFSTAVARHYFDRDVNLVVKTGPDTDDAGSRFLVKFDDSMRPDWFGSAGVYQSGGRISGCLINLNKKYLEARTFPDHEVGLVNHESGHCVFMSHTSDNNDRFLGESVMSGAQEPTNYDVAAAAVVYRHSGFGNRKPDINPSLAGASSPDLEDVCRYARPKK